MSCDSFEYEFQLLPQIAGRCRQPKVSAWTTVGNHSKRSLVRKPERLLALDETSEAGWS